MTRDQRSAGIWGALIGDALGVPYEFRAAAAIPAFTEIEMVPPDGYPRTYAGVKPGTWSDDGAQMLCLLESLLECGGVDPHDLTHRFIWWMQQGYFAVDQHVFDIGVQTSAALGAIAHGAPIEGAARCDEYSNGNGSLMRVLPLGLWHRGSDEELIDAAHLQSLPTHPHPRSMVCCAIYSLWVRYELDGRPNAFDRAVATARRHYTDTVFEEQLEMHVRPDDVTVPTGSGYVVDCLRSAQWLLRAYDTYEDVVRGAVALGNDTDTTACVAGGIAGVRFGFESIPSRWFDMLRGKELVEPLLERLADVERYSSASRNSSRLS